MKALSQDIGKREYTTISKLGEFVLDEVVKHIIWQLHICWLHRVSTPISTAYRAGYLLSIWAILWAKRSAAVSAP